MVVIVFVGRITTLVEVRVCLRAEETVVVYAVVVYVGSVTSGGVEVVVSVVTDGRVDFISVMYQIVHGVAVVSTEVLVLVATMGATTTIEVCVAVLSTAA